MAKARTKKTSNVIAMPGIESSALALEKVTELTDLDIARRAFEISASADTSMAMTLTTGCERNEN